jgi:hypothetical protein
MSKFDEVFQPTPIEDVSAHVRNAVHINGGDLRQELERLPGDLAHYGFSFASAHRRMLAGKLAVEEVRAAVYLLCREALTDLGSKVTEAMIESHVVQDARVREARGELVEAEYEREQLRAICDSLRAKRENLQSLVLLARAEMAGTSGFREPEAP